MKDDDSKPYDGKVLIIGAGAGGLTAGYLLQQQGVEFEILEASNKYGGRMKVNESFADFPIPLGAEWLETGQNIFSEIVNDSSINVEVETVKDAPDRKFVNYSWYNFFEEYIVPSISDKIRYNQMVESIDYSNDQIIVKTPLEMYNADKVIVCVPLKVIKDGDISFIPNLPQDKLDAISKSVIWEGFKAFFEFSTKFYEDEFEFQIEPKSDGEKIYYNASFGQNTSKHILGLFVVGKPALDYTSLSDEALKSFVLSELDGMYSNKATANYIKHITQNWENEPFIKSGYLSEYADYQTVSILGKQVSNKIYFSGGEFTDGEDWVSVHTAARSAKKVVEELSS